MVTVTQRIKKIKQPYGGYVNPKSFIVISLNDKNELIDKENIHSSLVGMTVDYMTRFIMGTTKEAAFNISLMGSTIVQEYSYALDLLVEISGLDDKSIINACKLTGYDVCYRSGIRGYKPVQEINPDEDTISNIRIMIARSIKFFEGYGPIIRDGFTFEGGYSKIVSKGDGDFLTKDTLWDFKVSNKKPTSANTLQLLVYYIMGMRSIHNEFDTIINLGIFNPRLNNVYLLRLNEVPKDIIEKVSTDVIGY